MAEVTTTWPVFQLRRTLLAGVVLAVVGLGLAAIAIALDPRRGMLGYLAAYAAVISVAVGTLIFQLIAHAANATWPAPLRRVFESITVALPVLALLFLPIGIGLGELYPWVHEATRKEGWLDTPFFLIRSVIYLGAFVVAAEVLRRRSRLRDRELVPIDRDRRFSSGMLPPVGLAITFAAFDWLMSLQPAWFSSMFGVYYFAGGFGGAFALTAILAWRARERAGLDVAITPHHFHALGRMLLGFVVFWTYTHYFQGFLIQIADRPTEVTFFLQRTQYGWGGLLWVVLVTHFIVPFFLLLPRRLKMRPRYLAAVGALVLVGHVLDVFWIVVPASGEALSLHLADLASLVGIVGACIAVAAWRQRGVSVVPAGDPFLADGIRYASPT